MAITAGIAGREVPIVEPRQIAWTTPELAVVRYCATKLLPRCRSSSRVESGKPFSKLDPHTVHPAETEGRQQAAWGFWAVVDMRTTCT